MSVQSAESDQTPLLYPVSETNPPSDRESHGSFTPVFIVLAVILVVSVVACIFGRLCNRRSNTSKRYKRGNDINDIRETGVKAGQNGDDVFQTDDGDIEFGFDKRFSSAKVAAVNGQPNMSPTPNSFREPDMGRNTGRPNMSFEPNIGRPNSFREASMGRPESFQDAPMRGFQTNDGDIPVGFDKRFSSTKVAAVNGQPNMIPPNSFREPGMSRNTGRHSVSFEPNIGRPNSFRETSTDQPGSFQEAPMRSPKLYGKGEFRDDYIRFVSNEDYEMKFHPSRGPQHY